MGKPKISIVVPVYNMEMYLSECLDSIKSHTFSQWVCILLDDSSRDASADIYDEYAVKDTRFKVIPKANGELSSVCIH